MPLYNFFTDGGLTALLNSLKGVRKTAEGNTSAISDLSSDFEEMTQQVAGVVGDVATCIQELDSVKANTEEVEAALAGKLSLGDRESLASGTDLNTVTTPGSYKAQNLLLASSILNLPTGFENYTFILDVYKNNDAGNVTQRITSMTKAVTATRANTSGWSAWDISYSEAHKPTPSEIGALDTSGGTITGDLEVNKNIPAVSLSVPNSEAEVILRKNANASADYGTNIVDIVSEGNYTQITLGHNANEFILTRYENGQSVSVHKIYHQGNKPTIEEIGAAAANHGHDLAELGAAPAYTYGTEDLTAGTSELASGTLYFMYD